MDKSLDTTLAAVEDVRDRGGDVAEMREALVAALYEFAFDLVYLLDEPDGTSHDTAPHGDVADEDPRWVLMEQAPDGELTGRDVGNLHEDLWRDTQGK